MSGYNGPRNPRNPIPDGESSIIIYGYTPSLGLSITALVTFAICLAIHAWYLFSKKRTRTFQFLLCFGCLMELVGFGFRMASHYNPFVVIRFVIQYFMIVVAPVFFSAALYLSLSMAVQRSGRREILPLKPKLLVTIFVIIDVVTIALQVVGAAFIGVSESARARGDSPAIETNQANDILLAGLAVQSASFLVFLSILAVTFIRNRRRSNSEAPTKEKSLGQEEGMQTGSTISQKSFLVLALSSFAIWLRTLFRLGETAEGVFGYASTHEYLFGILEYTPIVIALALWAAFPLHKLLD